MGDNIKICGKEIAYKDVEWTDLFQERDQWQDIMKKVMKFRVQ
jgi:hypothetical protein